MTHNLPTDHRKLRPRTLRALLLASGLFVTLTPLSVWAQVPAACGDQPRLECRRAEKSRLLLKQKDGTRDRLTWKWLKGEATGPAEFGDPTSTTDYALCFYAGTHADPIAGTAIAADPSLWKVTGIKGFRYSDRTGAADGVRKIQLKAGEDGKAKVIVKGKGTNLPDPTLPSDLPLLVQLVNSESAVCWEDVYNGTDLVKQEADQVKVKAGPEDPTAPLPVASAATPLDALTAAEAGVPAYVGAPAVAQPMAPFEPPPHPFLAPAGDSRIHNDGYNSAVYNRPGPLGVNPVITTLDLITAGEIASVCAMVAFTPDGYAIASCIVAAFPVTSSNLLLLDPVTLDIHVETVLAPRPLVQNAAGGAYFSLDNNGRIVIGPSNNHVEVWEVTIDGGQPAFLRRSTFDVSGTLNPGDLLQDTVVDFQGLIWFASISGVVGYVDPATGDIETTDIAEGLQNSYAVDSTGVYIVSFDAMYKFSVDVDGSVKTDWRTPYDNTGPGLVQPGSGTTPTLFGTSDDLVGICDTALPQINAMIMDRTTGAVVCLTPLFRPNESGAENTLLAFGDDFVSTNNGGFTGSFLPQNTVYPGIERHQVRANRTGCDPIWVNHTSIGNSAQLSTSTGLIYGWGADPNEPALDAYYFTANDWVTGAEIFRIYAGNDTPFNPVLGQPHIGLDGSVYFGSLHGITRITDGP